MSWNSRTNKIPIKSVNHNGWIDIFVIKRTTFMFLFLTYLLVLLLKFRSGELIGCRIKFCIRRVPTLHTFDGPRYPKNNKYLKKRDDDIITFFQVSLIFGIAVVITQNVPRLWKVNPKAIEKTTFLFVFSTYLLMFLLKFRSRDLVGCGI